VNYFFDLIGVLLIRYTHGWVKIARNKKYLSKQTKIILAIAGEFWQKRKSPASSPLVSAVGGKLNFDSFSIVG
jgi:hypothetical protein